MVAEPPRGWRLARSQFPQRVSPLIAALQTQAFNEAAETEAAATGSPVYYGLAFIDGWAFLGPATVRAHLQTNSVSTAAVELFWSSRGWVGALSKWPVVRERAVAANRAWQGVDPVFLDDRNLAMLLERLAAHHREMIGLHRQMTTPVLLSLAVFVDTVRSWVDIAPERLVTALSGAVAGSRSASPQCVAAAEAAGHLLDDRPPIDILASLDGVPEAQEFIRDLVWRTSNGFDLFAPWVGEQPGWLVDRLRSARAAASDQRPANTPLAAIGAIRSAVPAEHRDLFDALAREALLGYEIRDERGLVSDAWSLGLLRRAVREAGTRLAVRGKLSRWEQLAYLEPRELTPALLDADFDHQRLIDADHDFRLHDDPPPVTQSSGDGPEPTAGDLPPAALRLERMAGLILDLVLGRPEQMSPSEQGTLRGVAASPGAVAGVARVLRGAEDLHLLEPGDILVVPTTTEAFTSCVHLVAAIVTDHGGIASHAAIVAREAGIPAVVGTSTATATVQTGSKITVDGSAGLVWMNGRPFP